MQNARNTLLAATLALATIGSARADSFASAILEIRNMRLLHSTGAPYATTDFSAVGGNNVGDASATLNGASVSSNQAFPVLSGVQPDVPHQCVGLCMPKAENDYTPFPNPPPVPYDVGYGDQRMNGEIISVVGGAPAGAVVDTRSDTSIQGLAGGSVMAATSSATTFTFELLASDSMTISFDARPYTQAHLGAGGSVADASVGWRLDLVQLPSATTVWSYAPAQLNGMSHLTRTSVGTLAYDPGTAAFSASSPVLFPVVFDPGAQSFSMTTPLLQASVQYQLTIRQETFASALQVPEPAALALLATGLLAMGGARRRAPRARTDDTRKEAS